MHKSLAKILQVSFSILVYNIMIITLFLHITFPSIEMHGDVSRISEMLCNNTLFFFFSGFHESHWKKRRKKVGKRGKNAESGEVTCRCVCRISASTSTSGSTGATRVSASTSENRSCASATTCSARSGGPTRSSRTQRRPSFTSPPRRTPSCASSRAAKSSRVCGERLGRGERGKRGGVSGERGRRGRRRKC